MKPMLKTFQSFTAIPSRDLLFLILSIAILFLFKSQNLELKLVNDFSPTSYVNSPLESHSPIQEPHNIVAKIYKASIVMRIFRRIVDTGVISPLMLSYVFLFLIISIFVVGGYFLSSSLFKSSTTHQLFVTLLVASSFSNANLSAYSIGGFHKMFYPSFYGISHGFGFFALSFYFRKKIRMAILFLVLAFFNHLSIGLFYIGALTFISFPNPVKYDSKSLLKSLLVLVGAGLISVFLLIPKSSGSYSMDPLWLSLMKSFGSHWFMLSSEILTTHFKLVTYPLLLSLFCMPLFYTWGKKIGINIFLTYVLLLSSIGLLFTEIYPVEVFIKVAPQRASFLLSLAFLLGASHLLAKKLSTDNFRIRNLFVVSIVGLLSLLTPALSVILVGFIVYSTWPDSKKWLRIYSVFLLILFASIVVYSYLDGIYDYVRLRPGDVFLGGKFNSHPKYYPYGVGVIFGAALLFSLFSFINFKSKFVFSMILLAFTTTKMAFEESNWVLNRQSRIEDLLEVQLWFRDTTKKEVGVWVDPVYGASWNSHSMRRKVGSFRDWSYNYLAYSSQYLDRSKWFFNLFSINLSEDLNESKSAKSNAKFLSQKFKTKFESLNFGQMKKLSRELHFDYLVLSTKHGNDIFNEFPEVFKNSSYRVLLINSEVL